MSRAFQAGMTSKRRQLLAVAAGALALAAGCGRSVDDAAKSVEPREADEVHVRVTASTEPAPLNEQELALQKKLQQNAAAERPTHRLTLRNGRTVEGTLVSESATSIRLREGFGYSGYTITPYKRADIVAVKPLSAESFDISPADVRLAEQFPGFHFVKSPPYSFVTDESYGEVQKILGVLTSLREQFEKKFAPLIRSSTKPGDIEVIFFSRDDAFRSYTRRTAPALENSAGFYSTRDNRLALLNQLGSHQFQAANDRLASRQREFNQYADADPHAVYEAKGRIVAVRADMTSEAKAMTERLVRHEGAHQLFHCYGVHSRYALEPTWLVEGLAEYCEPLEIGRWHAALAERVAKARDTKSLIPLATLLIQHDSAGFFALGADQTELAYAQSWSLVYFLMQDEHREAFFNFIRAYRDGNPRAMPASFDHAGQLYKSLRIDSEDFEIEWRRFVDRF